MTQNSRSLDADHIPQIEDIVVRVFFLDACKMGYTIFQTVNKAFIFHPFLEAAVEVIWVFVGKVVEDICKRLINSKGRHHGNDQWYSCKIFEDWMLFKILYYTSICMRLGSTLFAERW